MRCFAHSPGSRLGRGQGVALLLALAMLLAPAAGATRAQETATPTADVPAPEECLIAPHPIPVFPAGVGQRAAATPGPLVSTPAPAFVPPRGEAADAETVAAVTATVREALACRNAGDFLRAYALFTDDMLVDLFGGPSTVDLDVVLAVNEGPKPVPKARRLALVAISDVTLLPDGRAGAIVETRGARRAFRDYLFFAFDPVTGRWLIDGQEDLP